MLSRFCRIFLLTLVVALCVTVAQAKNVALLVEEIPGTPMRIETTNLASLISEIDSDATILYATQDGVVDRELKPVDSKDFAATWVYSDAPLDSNSAFSAPNVAQWLSESQCGLILAGSAAALAQTLGFDPNLSALPVDMGEDRGQAGLMPVNELSSVFSGAEEETIWITNAAFAAFNSIHGDPAATIPLARSAKRDGSLGLGAILNAEGRVRAFVFPWRVSPLFDAAAPEFKKNFIQIAFNLTLFAGRELPQDAATAPRFRAPDFAPLERALDAFEESFDEEEYPRLAEFRERLDALKSRSAQLTERAKNADDAFDSDVDALAKDLAALRRDAILANPEIDFDSFLYVSRDPSMIGMPDNFASNSYIPANGYQDELRRFNLRDGSSSLVYKPTHGEFIGDLELYFDASKLLFSAPDPESDYRWRVWELPILDDPDAQLSATPTILPLINDADVDNFDACYLGDDRVIFCSTACQSGVPCINGAGRVANLYSYSPDGTIRQLTVDQDDDWNPVPLKNGRVMYLRWEYVDLPHAFSRIMFHMNPDGTNQSELYGSGSYWPNAIFCARPLPGDTSKFVGIAAGHHDVRREGELVIFDPSKGRKEAEGVVQRIPGYGKEVSPVACDLPVGQTYPRFLHPYPISETAFLVSCKDAPDATWKICVADIYDNIVPIFESPQSCFEPIPLRETERPATIPDRIDPTSKTADVFIADIYEGVGLKGIERGKVKALRIFSYSYAYQGMGAEPYSVGLDGPWDPRRILGEVPVNEDGSAFFKIPAYTPISLQPLDEEGRAMQIMRSWITALPGETVSCVGCHEPQGSTSPTAPRSLASQTSPNAIEPFRGPTRGFSFEREIQPILDRYCVECHCADSPTVKQLVQDGVVDEKVWDKEKRPGEVFEIGRLPFLTKSAPVAPLENGNYIAVKSLISNSYYQLRRQLYTWTKESQMAPHLPCEFNAQLQPLVQLLEQGHFGVELDPDSWRALYAWIDLNAPYVGNWGDALRVDDPALVESQWRRREELRSLYATLDSPQDDKPTLDENDAAPTPVSDTTIRARFSRALRPETPLAVDESAASDEKCGVEKVALNDSVDLELVAIPGTNLSVGTTEITNEQYRAFDPDFDAGIEYADFIQFSPGERGWLLSTARQPVVRVSWKDANAFCEWLSEKTGDRYRLPTLEEAKYFATASASAPFWFGELGDDYSLFENLADSSYARISPFGWPGRVETLPAWRPCDWTVDDRARVSVPVASYRPNPFGLYDAQGNVAEWTSAEEIETREEYDSASGEVLNSTQTPKKVAFGGSWTTPSKNARRSSYRAYPDYFKLRDVGLRVVRENATR